MQLLLCLVLISQLAGAKECPGRRDTCETTVAIANQTSFNFDAANNKKDIF